MSLLENLQAAADPLSESLSTSNVVVAVAVASSRIEKKNSST